MKAVSILSKLIALFWCILHQFIGALSVLSGSQRLKVLSQWLTPPNSISNPFDGTLSLGYR
jgi:hypothetical protein